jgi:hypothetical protein
MLPLTSTAIRSCRRSRSPRRTPLATWGMRLVLAAMLTAAPAAVSDELAQDDTLAGDTLQGDVFADEMPSVSANDIRFSLPERAYCHGCDRPVTDCGCGGLNWPRLGMYVKAGPSGQWSEGLFKDNTSLGYQIAVGGRELLLPTNRKVFFDFGGSYLSAYGRGEPLTIGGSITRGAQAPQRLDEFLDLTLEEISRAGLHAAVGWYYDASSTPDDSRLMTMRFGGRISHVHGHFREDATDGLQTVIDTAIAAGQNFSLANDPAISKTDTAPGIFAGIELDHTRYLTQGATLSFLVDGEFASDWIDMKNYADSAMVTATLMFGVSVSR